MSTVDDDVLMGTRTRGTVRQTAMEVPVPSAHPARISGALVGTLIGFGGEGQIPLVLYPGQPGSAAITAASTVDLHATHIGRQVALMFDERDPRRPIIMGLLRVPGAWPLPKQPGLVEVDADGERLVVRASEQLVLQCGKASITLTKAGKVLIRGTYVASNSSGVNRIKGGTVQIN